MTFARRLLSRKGMLAGLLLVLGSLQADEAWAAACRVHNNPPASLLSFVDDPNLNYCELCGYGYVTVRITNPFKMAGLAGANPDMNNIRVRIDLPGGLELYTAGGAAVPAVSYRINGGAWNTLSATYYSGTTSVTVGTTAAGNPLELPDDTSNSNTSSTLDIRIAVHRRPDNSPESLHPAPKQASATLLGYDMADSCTLPADRYTYINPQDGCRDESALSPAACAAAPGTTNWVDPPGYCRRSGPGGNWSNPAFCDAQPGYSWYAPPQAWYDTGSDWNVTNNSATRTLDYRAPNIQVYKTGWNYDAGQREGTAATSVFGHNDDDIVWRLRIRNTGNARLQDLRLDDVLSRADVMDAKYVCPTAASANAVAANDGALPPGSPCVPTDAATGTVLADFDVDPPFGAGTHNNPYAGGTLVDIPVGGDISIYLVGKIQSNASCTNGALTNTLNDVEFGCDAQTPPGGIDPNISDSTTLYTYYGLGGGNNALRVTRNLTGLTQTPLGTRGMMTITLENRGRGTIEFDDAMAYHLKDTLPAGYVIDPSFTPTISNQSRFAAVAGNGGLNNGDENTFQNNNTTVTCPGGSATYCGKVDRITWSNPAPGTFPIDTSNPAPYLLNTEPEFKLSSSTSYTDSATGRTYRNLMRHGDVITIRFAVILKDPQYYDLKADLDELEESPAAAGTDPAAPTGVTNTLVVQFRTLCDGQGTFSSTMTGNGANNTFAPTHNGTPITANPEDLDVEVLDQTFILTNDPNQTLDLRARLINRGGHAARDFSVFVSFGATMEVVSATPPANYQCEVVTLTGSPRQPLPYRVWLINPPPDAPGHPHMPLPENGTVYRCYPNHANPFNRSLAPGASVDFRFTVRKSTDPLDLEADDLTFRADVVGEIYTTAGLAFSNPAANPPTVTGITNGPQSWFPAPGSSGNARPDGEVDRGNNYSLDAHWARGIGFNLRKDLVDPAAPFAASDGGTTPPLGTCSENNPPTYAPPAAGQTKQRERVQIGEECTYRIQSGGWFGFKTRGFNFIGVRDIQVRDVVPDGQAYISSTDPAATSHPTITGVTMDPPASPLVEGEFGWRFNTGPSDYIDIRDQWFTLNATTRILNDPLDSSSAAPNVHAANRFDELHSSFEAVFENNNTGELEVYRFGEGLVGRLSPNPDLRPGPTLGYPNQPIRRVDVVVTEPQLEVIKEVCDETLYGPGPACSNFVASIPDADTTHSYVFRLTLRNRSADNGQPRAPAYDVTVIDTLDSSDLMLVLPFESDGLDNDGDQLIDGADTDGEGTISDNTVLNGTPAVITFSHLHGVNGTGLRRIDPGETVYLYYRVDPDERAAPNQTLTNSFVATYDSLEGSANEHGNQTVVKPGHGTPGGARVYTSPTASASITIIQPQTQPKQVTALAVTPIAPTGTQEVKIGEEIEFTLTGELPVALLRNLTVTDSLPAGLSCAEAPVVDLSAGPYAAAGFKRPDLSPVPPVTPTCSANQVIWAFGDVVVTHPSPGNSRFVFPLKFIARVDNSAANNNGVTLTNGSPATTATLTWVDVDGVAQTRHYGQVSVRVTEPDVRLTKSFAPVVNADGGDELTVTVTATNNGTANAYNLRIWDDLIDRNLTFIQGSVSGADPPDSVDTTTFGANRPIFVWGPGKPLAPGATRTFTFRVRVDTAAQPLEILDNTLQAAWTSLPGRTSALNSSGQIGPDGSPAGMRIGTLPNSNPADPINDYETTATASVSVPPVTMTKTDNDPSVVPTIGAHKSFTIEIALPEGTTNDLVATDNLAAGGVSYVLARDANFDVTYEFLGIATINGQSPAEAAFIGFPTDGASGSITWNIGTVVTQTENDLAVNNISPRIRITYYARVNNDLVTDAGDTLQNGVAVTYDNGETGATETLNAITPPVTAVEPVLTVTKTVSNVTRPGNPAAGGDILEYVVTIPNSGGSTAHDVNIVDTLPAALALQTTFTPTATINGTPVAGFVATPANSPSGPLVWGRENGDESLDIPAGQSLVLTYRVVVQEVGGSLANSVWVDWTSLDGASPYERTGAGCPTWTAPNDYCVGPASATIATVDTTTFAKDFVADTYDVAPLSTTTDAIVRIGDIVTYRLALNLRGGLTRGVRVQDVLPAGMAFVDVVSVNGDTTPDYAPPASGPGSNFSYAPIPAANVPAPGQTGTLVWNLGDVVHDPVGNPTGTFEIVYRARVLPDAGIPHVASTALNNNASLSYIGSPALADGATITARQPIIDQITKIDRAGRASPAQVDVVNDTMQFRLQACNTSGQAPAYSVLITDVLAPQLDETSIAGPVNGAGQPDVVINGVAAVAGTDYVYTPPAGRGGTMSFRLNTGINPGQCVTIDYDIGFHTDFGANQIWNNSATVNEYWSLPAQSGQRYGPVGPATFTMNNVANTQPPTKTVVSPANGEITIGEEIVYRITVPGAPFNAAMYDVAISDVLDANLEFISATEVSGNNFTLIDNSVLPSQINLSIGQIPAGQQAVIDLRVRLRNNAATNAGMLINNSVLYTYADSAGGTPIGGGNAAAPAIRIVEPLVSAVKTVTNTTNPGNPPRGGDILRYTVTFTASGGTAGDDFADAFDLDIVDTLSLGLEYAGNATVSGAGNTIGAPQITGDGIATPQTLTWSFAGGNADIDIPEGTAVTVSYDVRVLGTVVANQTLSNSVVGRWTGIDGANAHERNGTGTPAYNDYFTAPATTTVTVADNNTVSKTRLTDTYGAGDANVRIGDIVEYELRLALQEGTHQGVTVTDTLPQGLRFEGVVSVNGDTTAPYSAVAPFVHADIAAPTVTGDPAAGPTTVSWNLGGIVNTPNGNAADDTFVIVYRARVLNEVHPQVNSLTLTNAASFQYNTATGTTARTDDESITLLQPNLSVAKSAVAAGGATVIEAGEVVTYTVDITNNGTAPAYDIVLVDTIPAGMRQGGVTMVGMQLAGVPVANLAPVYDAATGVATWNFDTGVANQYTIPAGATLRIVYQVKADAGLGAGLTLTNAAQATLYYSLDNDDVPPNGTVNGREVYGPSNTAQVTLTTPAPGALLKENTQPSAAIGEPFRYRITVPATPVNTALYDVRVLDDLSASAASLSFVSVAAVGGPYAWTPVNTGTATNLVIEDPVNGIDIPAGQQIVLEITVVLTDSPANTSGLLFSNTASYTYNQIDNNPATQTPGAPSTTPDMTIIGPDAVTLEKSGPATMRLQVPETFTLNVQNTGTGPAWNLTIRDVLPNPTPGGMCSSAPTNITAQIFQSNGTTPASPVLQQGIDYSVSFTGEPSCELLITMLSPAAVIGPTQRLIVTYQATLDLDSVNGTSLTNVAGATQWFGSNPAAGTPRTYTRTLTNGTVGTLDHEDAWTVLVEAPVLEFLKTVTNVTTGGTTANPGDVLRYRVELTNQSNVPLNGFSLIDEVDQLNSPAMFVPGSLTLVSPLPPGATNASDPNGGANGTGLIDIRDLSIGGVGSGTESVVVEFTVQLVPVITNGTIVLNQALLMVGGSELGRSDDPGIGGTQDPTPIAIESAPVFRVEKTSEDLTGDPNALYGGDTLRYTITVKNVGNENAVNVVLTDALPANTTYVANSTTLNGVSVPDVGGVSPLQSGMAINAPEDPTPGAMRADASSTTSNVATITFDVVVNAGLPDGTVIENQGFVNGAGAGGVVFPAQPSDDPATAVPDDPTRDALVRPNGIVYDSIRRVPIAGATLRMVRASTGAPLPASCFDDPGQQDQVTPASGFYRFDLNFSDPVQCPAGEDYLIVVTAVPSGYVVGASQIIPPSSSASTAPYSVPVCSADAVPATEHCEAQPSETPPTGAAPTTYYLHLTLSDGVMPRDSEIFNNHIPIDPELDAAVTITKTSPLINVTRGQLVPYTITVKNTFGGALTDLAIVDTLPPGFKYVKGSARFDGSPLEPVIVGRQARWENLSLVFDQPHSLKLLMVVGSGVSEGEYVNRAQVENTVLNQNVSNEATATVRVVPDPTFDCTDVIGKVYDDANLNGYPDENEKGIGGARVVSARGLVATTDRYGRFHITCAAVPNPDRGSNFILKLDERSLPAGYRVTTENPLVLRATRGKAIKFNFGAALHRVVRLDVADGVFEPNSVEVRPQWRSRFDLLIEELRRAPSLLRIAYLADVEDEAIVQARIEAIRNEIATRWAEQASGTRPLPIETETYWRRGGPPDRGAIAQ